VSNNSQAKTPTTRSCSVQFLRASSVVLLCRHHASTGRPACAGSVAASAERGCASTAASCQRRRAGLKHVGPELAVSAGTDCLLRLVDAVTNPTPNEIGPAGMQAVAVAHQSLTRCVLACTLLFTRRLQGLSRRKCSSLCRNRTPACPWRSSCSSSSRVDMGSSRSRCSSWQSPWAAWLRVNFSCKCAYAPDQLRLARPCCHRDRLA
jgi:hypothetical protein